MGKLSTLDSAYKCTTGNFDDLSKFDGIAGKEHPAKILKTKHQMFLVKNHHHQSQHVTPPGLTAIEWALKTEG